MSNSILRKVMGHYPGAGGEYTLALCLAEVADDCGKNIQVTVKTLAHYTRQSGRTVQRQLRAMESSGWLKCVSGKNGGKWVACEYEISKSWLDDPRTWVSQRDAGNRWRLPRAGHIPQSSVSDLVGIAKALPSIHALNFRIGEKQT
jgi:hypothetical protein